MYSEMISIMNYFSLKRLVYNLSLLTHYLRKLCAIYWECVTAEKQECDKTKLYTFIRV